MKKKLFAIFLAVLIAFSGGYLYESFNDNEEIHSGISDIVDDIINLPEISEEDNDNKQGETSENSNEKEGQINTATNLNNIPEYSGQPFVVINKNNPQFSRLSQKSWQNFSELDSLGRAGVATACIQKEMMPTEKRGSIGMIKPTGWHTVRYDDIIPTKYLYNRCHLIGFQLTGENDNELNLITGTRYMNVDGMLDFENRVAEYLEESENHVMYRVTPVYIGKNLLCSGVQMEAYSVEDKGKGICFNVFVYNVQPGIEIDYRTGESWALSEADTDKKE